jgi:hypothetical protein
VFLRAQAGQIKAVRYQVRGCPTTVAALEWVAREWTDRRLTEVAVNARDLLQRLESPVTKLTRVLVVEAACQHAVLQASRESS